MKKPASSKGRPRGRRKKRGTNPTKPHNVGVRLTVEEFKRLEQQAEQDGRHKGEILRDWFTEAPDPQPLPQLRVRRMGAFELASYRQLLSLARGVWNLEEQARRLHLPAVQAQAEQALAEIHRLASSLVPLPEEDITDRWEPTEPDDEQSWEEWFVVNPTQ